MAIPYLVLLVAELVAERFAYKAVTIQRKEFVVGLILGIIAYCTILVGSGNWSTCNELKGYFSLLFCLGFKLVQTDEVTIENNLIASGDMRPVSKSVKLVVAVWPVGIRLTLVLCRAVPPSTAAGVAYDAHHIAIASLQFGIIIHMRHNERGEDAILLCRLSDISQCTGIALASISSAYDSHYAVLAVLIP